MLEPDRGVLSEPHRVGQEHDGIGGWDTRLGPVGQDPLSLPVRAIDQDDPHWAYTWVAQYDDFDGPFIHEWAAGMRARSAAYLAAARCHRLLLVATPWSGKWGGSPGHTIEFRAQIPLGERLATYWTVDQPDGGVEPIIHRCVRHTLPSGIATFTFLAPSGLIQHGTRANW